MKPAASSRVTAKSEAVDYYTHRSTQTAVGMFCKKANGFYDVAFTAEDIRQEAAIACWRAREKNTKIIYRRLVDAHRRISPLPRAHLRGKQTVPIMQELSEELVDSTERHELAKAGSEFRRLVQAATAYPKLEAFICAFYVEHQTRAQVRSLLGLTEWEVMQHVKTTKLLAASCF